MGLRSCDARSAIADQSTRRRTNNKAYTSIRKGTLPLAQPYHQPPLFRKAMMMVDWNGVGKWGVYAASDGSPFPDIVLMYMCEVNVNGF